MDDTGRAAPGLEQTPPQPYDFRRPDRIAKDRLRAIRLLHTNFGRTLANNLSGYLRTYTVANLISVEQMSFSEFTHFLPPRTCLVKLRMKPSDGYAVIELTPSLVFPVLEILLGGNSRKPVSFDREITEIEQSVLEGLFRIVLHDLQNAWRAVTPVEFAIEGQETQPQMLQMLAPNEAVVVVSMEIRIGDTTGMMNIGIPSLSVKLLRHRFDHQWSHGRGDSTEEQQERVMRLIENGTVEAEVRMEGSSMTMRSLLELREDGVLAFDHPVNRPVHLALNGKTIFQGRLMAAGNKRAFRIADG